MQEKIILVLIEGLFGIMCPVIALITLISLIIPKRKFREIEKHHSLSRISTESFLTETYQNFIYVSNQYMSKKIPILGVIS